MKAVENDYLLCGWRVASALPLPDLLPWQGDDRAPDLRIALGPVPERLDVLILDRPFLQVAADKSCRFTMPGVANYLIDGQGRQVVIAPVLDSAAPDIRVFLFGTVFGIICYRRGLLPLHASCVRMGDTAVAFAGPSGMGKSTLAASLMQRGFVVLADDVTVVDFSAQGGPQVLPTFPRLKLWRDAMQRIAAPTDGMERSRQMLDKFHLPVEADFQAAPLPLKAIFHLSPEATDSGLRRLHGAEAVIRLGQDLYRNGMMVRFGLSAQLLPALAALAAVPGGCWLLQHAHEAGGLERSIATILRQMAP